MRIIILAILIAIVVIVLIAISNSRSKRSQHRASKMVIPNEIKTSSQSSELSCGPPPVTGNVKVVTSDTKGDSNCAVRLGDNYDPLIGQPFSVTWNDSFIPDGGYILTWGDTTLFYGQKYERQFKKNLTIVTQRQFLEDGKGFSLDRGGIIPCECCSEGMMKTPFYVMPVRKLIKVQNRTKRNGNSFEIDLEPNAGVDTYVVSVKVQRNTNDVSQSNLSNFAYHGIISSETHLNVDLPPYEWSDEVNFGQYDSLFTVLSYGYVHCDVGIAARGSAGNFATFN